MVILYPLFFQFVFHLSGGWTVVLIFMCVLMFLCLSLLDDVCNKVVNNVNVSDESNIWHSRLFHINFGCLTRLVNLNLIPKFNLVKYSKC